jgi:hypothetical protein
MEPLHAAHAVGSNLIRTGINIVDSDFKRVSFPSCFAAGGAAASRFDNVTLPKTSARRGGLPIAEAKGKPPRRAIGGCFATPALYLGLVYFRE